MKNKVKRQEVNIDEVFPIILSMAENGFGIREAPNKLKVQSSTFYRKLNEQQRLLLIGVKITQCTHRKGIKRNPPRT